jgi:ATP-dependent Zn protease
VKLTDMAKATPGLVGADLANIVNEAAIMAVRNGHNEIWQSMTLKKRLKRTWQAAYSARTA